MCNSGISLVPVVQGQLSHFRVYGLYQGLLVMEDLLTGSVWHHLTGECLQGPLAGARLDVLGSVLHLTAAQALHEYPQAHITFCRQSRFRRWYARLINTVVRGRRGFIPPPFYRTMLPADGRLPRLELGLGVWDNSLARFYPLKILQSGGVVDDWHGRELHIGLNRQTNVPSATFKNAPGEKPWQTFTRWYGFAATFPDCEIFSA